MSASNNYEFNEEMSDEFNEEMSDEFNDNEKKLEEK